MIDCIISDIFLFSNGKLSDTSFNQVSVRGMTDSKLNSVTLSLAEALFAFISLKPERACQ
jgi:hypothetical protein